MVHQRLLTDGVGHGARYAGEVLVPHAVGGKFGHVARRGVVPLLVEAVGVFEAGLGHAELGRLGVHQLRKLLHAVRDMQRERRGGVVAGDQQQAVEQVLDCVALSRLEVHRGALDARATAVDLHEVVELAVLEHDDGSHYLRRAGDEHVLVGVLLIEHPA